MDEFDETCREHDAAYWRGKNLSEADLLFARQNIGRGAKRTAAALAVGAQGVIRRLSGSNGSNGSNELNVTAVPPPAPPQPHRLTPVDAAPPINLRTNPSASLNDPRRQMRAAYGEEDDKPVYDDIFPETRGRPIRNVRTRPDGRRWLVRPVTAPTAPANSAPLPSPWTPPNAAAPEPVVDQRSSDVVTEYTRRISAGAIATPQERESVIRQISRAVFEYVRTDGLSDAQRTTMDLSLRTTEFASYAAGRLEPIVRRAGAFIRNQGEEAASQLWHSIRTTGPVATMSAINAVVDGVVYTNIGVSMLAHRALRASAAAAAGAEQVFATTMHGTRTLLEASRAALSATGDATRVAGANVVEGVQTIARALPPELVLSLVGQGVRNGYDAAMTVTYASGHLMGMIMASVPPHLRDVREVTSAVADEAMRYILSTAQAYRRQESRPVIQSEDLQRRRRRSNGIDPANILTGDAAREAAVQARENFRDAARESRGRYERPPPRRSTRLTRLRRDLIEAGFSQNQGESLSADSVAAVEELIRVGQEMDAAEAGRVYGTPPRTGGRNTPKPPPPRRGGMDTPP